ncbi:uncharacterized protein [Hemitrygon akajei]|uniref:uncharacterized protein n=1 Tax=Hemitrygon akajei TaxID=2704970 RepID=UPI003BF9ED05
MFIQCLIVEFLPTEPVSVPVLRYLSPANVSRIGGSVSVSCESFQGSLPIQYRWHEQTSSGHPKISNTNELTLHCQSFNQQHHQYYCSASNQIGANSSGMVNVTVFNNGKICSYVTEINAPDITDVESQHLAIIRCLICIYKYLTIKNTRDSVDVGQQQQHIQDVAGPGWVSMNKMMWTSFLLIGFLPVSGALWAEKSVRGVVGRATTIDCHYQEKHRSNTKYWCHGWTPLCSIVVETNGRHGWSGRVSITDNPEWGIFTVTMEDLRSGDTGWYSCGIITSGLDTRYYLHLQVSEEPVSVPVVRYLSPANVSRVGGSVLVSCESFRGSLPIQYAWYEQTSSGHRKISYANEMALHCQSFTHQHHQYYCRASNRLGARSSGIVKVIVFNNGEICSYVTEINGTNTHKTKKHNRIHDKLHGTETNKHPMCKEDESYK